MFTSFLERGLSLLASGFVRTFLEYFGLQLHHLSPNNILQLSCFVALCEGYLGIRPHLGLWC